MPNLTKVLSEFGLSIGNGLIVEQDNARMYQNPIYLLPNVSSDSLTNGVYGKSYDYIMMPYAQPILAKEKDGVTLTTLLTTSEKAYSKADLNQSSDVKKTEDDAQGPFTVGVKAVKTLASGEEAQLILYSSSYLFTESANQYTMDNNLTLFTNAISTMAGESESISIPTKSMASTYATVPTASAVPLWNPPDGHPSYRSAGSRYYHLGQKEKEINEKTENSNFDFTCIMYRLRRRIFYHPESYV